MRTIGTNSTLKGTVATVAIVVLALLVCLVGYQQQSNDRQQTEISARLEHVEGVARFGAEAAVAERIVELPDDGNVYQTCVLLDADWQKRPDQRRLVAWFESQPELASFKAQTQFHLITPDVATHAEFVEAAGGQVPAVFVQTESGRAIYKISGKNLPATPAAMADELVEIFDKRPWLRIRPWKRPRPCPGPKPCPEPEPKPEPKPGPNINVRIPDLRPVRPAPAESGEADFWVILAIAVAAAGGLAVAVQWTRRTD